MNQLTLRASTETINSFGLVIPELGPLTSLSFLNSFFLLFDPILVRLVNLGDRFCFPRLRLVLDPPSRLVWPRLKRFCTHHIIVTSIFHPSAPGSTPCTLVLELGSPSAPARPLLLSCDLAVYNIFPYFNGSAGSVFPSPRFPMAEILVPSQEARTLVLERAETRAKKHYSSQEIFDRLQHVRVIVVPVGHLL